MLTALPLCALWSCDCYLISHWLDLRVIRIYAYSYEHMVYGFKIASLK